MSESTSCLADVLFSDVDGTLVHYPKDFADYAEIVTETPAADDKSPEMATIKYKETGETRECVVLNSLTGGKAYLSLKSRELIQNLRDMGVVFVIITGARSSTYIGRRAALPEADYEFFENGGRKLANGVLDAQWTDQFESQIGPVKDRETMLPELPAVKDRSGSLWGLYEELAADGWTLDARNYVTNFRVDVKKSPEKTAGDFQAIADRECEKRGLASSFNLGKADVYPASSGKGNAARHILEIKKIDKGNAVALFDDDNDIELGNLCGKSFLPGVTHESVLEGLKNHPEWSLMTRKGFLGTEVALQKIIELREAAQKKELDVSTEKAQVEDAAPETEANSEEPAAATV